MSAQGLLADIFAALPHCHRLHAREGALYNLLKKIARQEIEARFSSAAPDGKDFGPFGELVFPYHQMGAIDSLNLFDLDELIIFSFYWHNRDRYRRVLDVGANLGLHSLLLSKCGFEVTCYEPDPVHFQLLQRNLALNGIESVNALNLAMSSDVGEMEFVRVLGNTTGSHLAGSKVNPYGELDRFKVKLAAFQPLLKDVDFVKLDVEGHEKEVLLSTSAADWQGTDALIEIENAENAAAVFDHFQGQGVNLFSQKTGWQRVDRVEAMPTSYRQGTLFLSCQQAMPWPS